MNSLQTILLGLAAFCSLIFAILATALVSGNLVQELDVTTINALAQYVSPPLTLLALMITWLGSSTCITIAMLAGALFAVIRHRNVQMGILFLTVGLGSSALMSILKILFHRLRPEMLHPIHHALGYSFPSGHASSSSAVYGLYIILTLLAIKKRWLRVLISSLLTLMIMAIAFSRVYLGVHYPVDVVAGLCLGTAWTCACFSAYLESQKSN